MFDSESYGPGTGQFGAVGFSYGNDDGSGEGDDGSGASSSGSDSAEDEDEDAGGTIGDADGLAANLGIDAFSATLRRAEREEAALALGLKPRKKCAFPRSPARTAPACLRERASTPPAPRGASQHCCRQVRCRTWTGEHVLGRATDGVCDS